MADINTDQIIEQLSQLTVMQIADLTKKLEDKWGVKAAPVAVAAAAGPAAARPAAKGGQTGFTCVLTRARANKIPVIKGIRGITHPPPQEAKDLVDGAP